MSGVTASSISVSSPASADSVSITSEGTSISSSGSSEMVLLWTTRAFKHAHSSDRFDRLFLGSANRRKLSAAGDDGGMTGDEGMCSHNASDFCGVVWLRGRCVNGSRGRGYGRSRADAMQSRDKLYVRL